MPKSKRDKKVSLTKTTKKGKQFKQELIENIRKNLDEFDSVYVFTVHNMRNAPLKEVREDWKGSRFFFAKKKIMAIALGKTEASEVHKNVHKIAKQLSGQCGLLFTNKPKGYVVEWFQNFSKMDFAKSGFVATRTVTLPAGPLPDFSHAIEPHLRSLGLPTRLEKGVIVLREEHTVCTEGSRLKPEEASVLKLLGELMAEFKISLLCRWSKDGSYEKFKVSTKSNSTISKYNEVVKLHTKNKMKKEKLVCVEENTLDQENSTNTQQSLTNDKEIIEPMANLTTSESISDDQDDKIPEEKIKSPKKKRRTECNGMEWTRMESSQSTSETLVKVKSEDNISDQDVKISEEKIKTSKMKKRTSRMESSQSTSETPVKVKSEDNISDQDVKISEEKIKTSKMKKRTSRMKNSQSTSETPMEDISEDVISDQDVKIPGEKIIAPIKNKRTTSKLESSQSTSDTPMEDYSEDMKICSVRLDSDIMSPKFGKNNPRRSLRTPKPIKGTPDKAKHSDKKLTITANKVQKSTPRGTPKRPKE